MTLNRTSTYGMEFELLSDPLKKSTRTYARILYVLPDSPADKAGIKRGDWISAIDNQKLNNKNYVQMMTGGNLALSREAIVTTEDGNRSWQVLYQKVQIGIQRELRWKTSSHNLEVHIASFNIASDFLVRNKCRSFFTL